jgi:metallo-beta-lactamase family protein
LIDGGFFQVYKELRLRNWANLPINPRKIDYVLLTHAYIDHSGYIHLLIDAEQNRLTKEQTKAVCAVAHYINSVDESIALDHTKYAVIIISASGMVTGDRINHRICHFAPNPKNTILFSGFLVGRVRCDKMIRGEREIKMFVQMTPICFYKVQIENISAHADSSEMPNWLAHLKKAPRKQFIAYGEMDVSRALKSQIEQRIHWKCEIPSYLDCATLCEDGP